MNWVTTFFSTSVGKKILMSITGMSFIGFLVVHLIGNLTIYGGKDYFDSYVDHLHSLGPVLHVFEIGLLTFALIHVLTGAVLTFQNFLSRPVRYQMNRNAGGRTLGSATMPYTGAILLIFLVFHVLHFHFADHTVKTTFEIVTGYFVNPFYAGAYVCVMIVAAFHVSHGFWSAFQTLGINHGKYTPMLKILSLLFACIVAAGFGFLPIYFNMFI
ncbi:MAG: succinate dehydrogenase cytochrome b subunit [Proteobacteria bacterium]|nr:succinate dehydrogenase cytochrome b subunit [Pseudomonadota bacterium]